MKTSKTNLSLGKTQMFSFPRTSKLMAALIMCLALVVSCSDDDPDEVLEEEFITNVILTFVNNADATDIVVMSNNAPDGQDGSFVNSVVGNFTSGATYSLSLAIENRQETPADDVLNDDIIPEADEHFFSYGVSGLNMTVTRDADDVDGPDGTKLGVNTTWVVGAAGMGNFNITLTHEPANVDDSNGFGLANGGETDFAITFTDVEVQ